MLYWYQMLLVSIIIPSCLGLCFGSRSWRKSEWIGCFFSFKTCLPKLPGNTTCRTICTYSIPGPPSQLCSGSVFDSVVVLLTKSGSDDSALYKTTSPTQLMWYQVMNLPVIPSGSHSSKNCFVCFGLSTILGIPCHVSSWSLDKYLTSCFFERWWKLKVVSDLWTSNDLKQTSRLFCFLVSLTRCFAWRNKFPPCVPHHPPSRDTSNPMATLIKIEELGSASNL